MQAFQRLVAAVAEFHDWVELPRHQHLVPKLMFEFTPESVWNDSYKVDPKLCGCYVFEDPDGDLYYIGSVSANSSYGYRFANGYVCKNPDDASKIQQLGNAARARRIYVVDVPREYAFIAPALEQFLISYLCPNCNAKDRVEALTARLISEGKIPPPLPSAAESNRSVENA